MRKKSRKSSFGEILFFPILSFFLFNLNWVANQAAEMALQLLFESGKTEWLGLEKIGPMRH